MVIEDPEDAVGMSNEESDNLEIFDPMEEAASQNIPASELGMQLVPASPAPSEQHRRLPSAAGLRPMLRAS